VSKGVRLPPGCGADLAEPLYYNKYQADFMAARRLRFCRTCKTTGSMTTNSVFQCQKCRTIHTSNMTAPRVFNRLGLLAGRGSGKTLIGAHAVREECLIPNNIVWVMGPTFKILHDSTFPTLVRRLSPDWIKKWDPEHVEITLVNGTLIAFRSLEDPERARGPHGVGCGWFDEAAQAPVRAYNVFSPTLIKAGGIVIATTTPLGFDWTYDELEKQAKVYKEPGYWWGSYWTEDNPLFKMNPTMMAEIERERKRMTPEFFAQEYRAERRNATGLIYDYSLLEKLTLADDAAVKRFIPEWPAISPSRDLVIGLDSGADHPFGAVLLVVTEFGLVAVAEYLERNKALSQHLPAICQHFRISVGSFERIKWAANKNEAQLRLEFGLAGVGVIQAENKHEVGIQRVQSWLYSEKIFFAYTVPKTLDQMKAYRYAPNLTPQGEKKPEKVFKLKDELPDAIRYALMAWPELPEATAPTMTEREKQRWESLDATSREQITMWKDYNKRNESSNLEFGEENYPLGSFFGPDTTQGLFD
jgi:hypothetical protein